MLQPWKSLVEYLTRQKRKALRRSRLRREGRELWKDFRRNLARSISCAPSLEANQRAALAFQRLAPEATVRSWTTYEAEISGHGIIARDAELNGKCCRYTFGWYNDAIPALEKALTLYLWRKLFPKRYFTRPLHEKWTELP
jgi:hypothetical protein